MALKTILMKSLVVLAVFAMLTASFSYAQRLTGKITGTVTDEDGVLLPGVTVEASSPVLMGTRAEVTSDKGVYRFINLPPGKYKLVFKLEGFQTVERENVSVPLNATVTENLMLRTVTLEETITVTAESPVVDVSKSSLSSNYDKDQLEKLPTGRFSYFDIVKQTAGFTTNYGESSSRMSAYGSNSEENAMYMDGVDLSNPEIGQAWLYQTADMFAEVEVSGVGAPAEYGNFTGAVINVVSKSGGNIFSGTATYYGQFDALTGDNNIDPDTWDSFQRDKFYDIAFTLGGPIIKDRIWFFGVYQKQVDSYSDWQDDPNYPGEGITDEQFFKITAQLSSQHKLVLSFDRQYWYGPDVPDPYWKPEALCAETDPVYSWNAQYTWLISSDAFFELKYSGYYSPCDYLPHLGGDVNQPYHYDGYTGVSSGGPYWPWEYIVTRNQANATLSYFAEDFLAGDHEFKVGVQYNRGTSEAWGGYGGEKYYYDWDGYPYLLYEYAINRYGGIVNNIGVFLDDSWKIGNRLTVNLGLRFDNHNASIPSFPVMDGWTETSRKTDPVDDLITWSSFSPRIGIAFQLTSDQKTLLKASFGRYYSYPYIANWEWPGPDAPTWYAYWWTGTEWELWDEVTENYIVDENLKNPYADQFSIGLERELLPELSIGATYVYKIQKDLFGYTNRIGTYEQVQRTSPDNDQTYTVWNQLNPGEEEHFLTNPEGWDQTYHGLILTLNKRYSHRWLLNASFTLSKSEGLNLSAASSGGFAAHQQSLVWYTGKFGTDPNELINADGPLQLDRLWSFKMSAGYTFPLDILASVNMTYQQGRPRLKFVRIYDLDQRPASYMRIIAEPKGTQRFDSMFILDFRVQKTFNLHKTFKLHAFADVFNLLNDDTVLRYRSYDFWKTDQYVEPRVIPWPRRVQIGVKLEF